MAIDLFTGGAVVGVVTAMWSKIKLWATKINRIIFVKVDISSHIIASGIRVYLMRYYKKSSLNPIYVQSRFEYIKSLQKYRAVGFQTLMGSEASIWRKGWRFLLLTMDYEKATLTFIRGTLDYKKFIEDAIVMYHELSDDSYVEKSRFFIIQRNGKLGETETFSRNSSLKSSEAPLKSSDSSISEGGGLESKYEGIPIIWSTEELGLPRVEEAIDRLSLSDKILDSIDEVIRWKKSEKWFKDRNIPWKMGLTLTGDPGTGKTAFVRAIAQKLNIPIVVFNLSTMSNRDFLSAWEDASSYLPAIFLFEDMDAVFDKRINLCSTATSKGVSFDILLNTIDGVNNTDGILLIITTNHIDKLDDALGTIYNGISTRPGRIDRVLKFERLDLKGKEKIANRIFAGIDSSLWRHLLYENENDTGAQFQFRCSSLALKLWKKLYTNEV